MFKETGKTRKRTVFLILAAKLENIWILQQLRLENLFYVWSVSFSLYIILACRICKLVLTFY